MNEVLRFRIARAPQRVVVPAYTQLVLTEGPALQEWLNGDALRDLAQNYLAELGLLPPARRFAHPDPNISAALSQLRWLDQVFVEHDNRVAWADIQQQVDDRLDGDPRNVGERWAPLREALSLALVAAAVTNVTPALRTDLVRLLLVFGILELAAAKANLDADDVVAALRWRNVLLPPRLLDLVGLHRSQLARLPGVSDHYVVREEWARYEVGEIAHIENVLKGELKEHLLERTDESETTTTLDKESDRIDERDTQTTDRFELKAEASRETALAFHIDGKVDVSAQYGPMVHLDASVGMSFDYSVKEAERRAVTQARETIARAVVRIEERIREQRVARTLTRVRTADTHTLDNKSGTDNIAGIYRWVDKIKTVQVFKYPHRLLFEFEVPEPGAFLRWLHSQPKTGASKPPIAFTLDGKEAGTPLTPELMTSDAEAGKIDYLALAQRYAVQGLTGPPGDGMVFVPLANPNPELDMRNANKVPQYVASTVSVPDGFEATSFSIFAHGTDAVGGAAGNPTGWLEVAVGTQPMVDSNTNAIWRFGGKGNFGEIKTLDFPSPVTGQIPVQLRTDDTSGLAATVKLSYRPTEAKLRAWRFGTFDLIQGAYWELRRQHEQALAQATLQAGIIIEGDSPTRNAEIMREELKRAIVELLSGSPFDGRPGMTAGTVEEPARIDFQKAAETMAEIQFVEQAFEWENISYVLYPYFWADVGKWAELQRISSPDADFDRFLRSGSARVVVPARPGFEFPAQLYTLFGTLWAGGPAPVPGDDLYLAIADEIRAQDKAPKDGKPGEWWEVRLPTTLVYLSPMGTTLPLKHDGAELPKT